MNKNNNISADLLNFDYYVDLKSKNLEISETICVLTEKNKQWVVGIIDGKSTFVFKNEKLEKIYVMIIYRDLSILKKLQNILKMGIIKKYSEKNYIYIINKQYQLKKFIKYINGFICVKNDDIIKACEYYNIKYIAPDYHIKKNSAYFSGLIDSRGSILYNYKTNTLEIILEFKQTVYTICLNFNLVIKDATCYVSTYRKKNNTGKKYYYLIRYIYSKNEDLIKLYNYFLENRLYSEFKFYRVMLFKQFLLIRSYKNDKLYSNNNCLYHSFLLKFYKYKNDHKKLPMYVSTRQWAQNGPLFLFNIPVDDYYYHCSDERDY